MLATEDYVDVFSKDGVLVFPQIYNHEALQIIHNEINRIRKIVMAKIADMPRPLATYSDIAERELNRLDYRCGFTDKIFTELAQPVVEIVQRLSPRVGFRYYWGAIPSLGGAGPTSVHRDIYSIYESDTNDLDQLDLKLPPYYFTVLIPLMKITPELGPTQFIKGSHRQAVVEPDTKDMYAPLLSPGDIVIFDGRLMHRGAANNTKQERMVAYLTFVANWYHDQTFKEKKYLFPELSLG